MGVHIKTATRSKEISWELSFKGEWQSHQLVAEGVMTTESAGIVEALRGGGGGGGVCVTSLSPIISTQRHL